MAVSEAWAAKKQQSSSSKPASTKPSAKPGAKPSNTSRNARPTNARQARGGRTAAPQGPVAHTAEDPVIERPPQGTTAAKLPPVKAQEPPSEWRTYEITTTVNLKQSGQNRLWLPLPLNQDTLFQRTLGHAWEGNPVQSSMRRLPDGNLETFYCEWKDGNDGRLQLRTQVTTADRHFDITKRTVAPEREDILRKNLQASQLVPNDGLAHQLGERILGRIKDPVAQAKAIYDWVIENSIYDPSLPGCGTGDVRTQLVRGQYGGRSADINGLFVSLCRAIGIPARRVFGQRIEQSRIASSLGIRGDATHAAHCRAEFYVPGYSWIPVDPSDVRRTIAMEGLDLRDSKLTAMRKILFGVWEMNWMAYNVAEDLTLPNGPALPFFTLPRLERLEGALDGLDPGSFVYSIRSRQQLG